MRPFQVRILKKSLEFQYGFRNEVIIEILLNYKAAIEGLL